MTGKKIDINNMQPKRGANNTRKKKTLSTEGFLQLLKLLLCFLEEQAPTVLTADMMNLTHKL